MYSGFPSKNFHLPEKLARHPSTGKNGDKEANKPVKEKERKEKERDEKTYSFLWRNVTPTFRNM